MKFGLIGHPIEHSLSPALFRAGYDGRYPYELLVTPDFDEAFRRFADGDYDGINVTAPFKELALKKADIISEECRLTGATNLLMKTPEGIAAYNSDFRGLCIWLRHISNKPSPELSDKPAEAEDQKSVPVPWPQGEGPAPQAWEGFFFDLLPLQATSTSVLIVGMGGAGKAAAAAAWANGMQLTLMNRDLSKAEEMAKSLKGMTAERKIEARPLTDFCDCFRKADIIIYNLPVRIPELDGLTAEDFQTGNGLGPKHILEANYRNPSFDDKLLQLMKESNPKAEYTAGQTWLLLQAVTGYEIFTGERPDLSVMAAQI